MTSAAMRPSLVALCARNGGPTTSPIANTCGFDVRSWRSTLTYPRGANSTPARSTFSSSVFGRRPTVTRTQSARRAMRPSGVRTSMTVWSLSTRHPRAWDFVGVRLQKLGIEVHTKSQARGWRVDKDQTVIDVLTPEGLIARRADCVLVTVGRRPNTDELNVDRAGVEFAPRGYVKVDRQLRTSNPHVFAIGEVVGGHPAELDYRALPAAIFTDPEIATVGLQEPEAVAQGRKVRIGKVPFAAIGRALTTGEYDGFVKLLADPSSNVLLGATIAGPDASDLISELSLGIEMGATIADIALTIHPHPTLPEAIMESAEAALGEAIHVLNR